MSTEFQVLAESTGDGASGWAAGSMRLAVDGSPVTLCVEPIDRFVLVAAAATDPDLPWCGLCWSTAWV